MIFFDLIPKSVMGIAIALLVATSAKLYFDKSSLTVEVAQLETAIATANAKSAEISESLTRKVLDAQVKSKQRKAVLAAEKHDLDTALDSLRLSTSQARAAYRLSGPTTTTQYLDAGLDALDQCAKEYSDVAAVADQYGSNIKTLMEAWPK